MNAKIFTAAAVAIVAMTSCNSTPKFGKDSIDDVVAAMTLEEKARLVVGTGMAEVTGDSAVVGATRAIVPGAAGTTYPIVRLGIPAVVLADGPAGLRIDPVREGDSATYYCTHFPISSLLASTWDTELVENVGKCIGNEVLEYGADVLLAPALNIHRNPLCGRNFEYYSEDPLVAGKIAAAYVKGVQSNGVGTSIKHFAGNNQETNRTGNDARMSERALREIYLRGFETVVKEAKPWTVMSSYNCINGTYTSESEDLLTGILRDEWGYDGMVMTDWYGGKDAVAQMIAGNDMLQPGTDRQYEAIVAGVQNGTLDEAVLNRNVKRILEMIQKSPKHQGYEYTNAPALADHAAVTRQSATEGMVLLKNANAALPLKADIKNIALFGCTGYDFIAGGTGSGNVNRAYTVSLLDGLTNQGYAVDQALRDEYNAYVAAEKERIDADPSNQRDAVIFPRPRPTEMVPTSAQLAALATADDAAIITLGRTSGEFYDRKASDFNLSKEEKQMIEAVTKAFHAKGKPVVVVLNIGGVIETASWKDMPDAILCAWQGGQEGGNSVADVLKGAAAPSGRLPMTFPVAYADHASSANFPVDGAEPDFSADRQPGSTPLWDYTNYDEDIYVGYRYFDSFGKDVSYPFGYGLTYTTFEYGNPAVGVSDGTVTVTVDVTNAGQAEGREVVQVYAKAPDAKAANKPEHELRAFAKTKALKPGEKQTLTLAFPAEALASFDEEASAWVVAPGEYTFEIGASSRDIRNALTATLGGSTQAVPHRLQPQAPLRLLAR